MKQADKTAESAPLPHERDQGKGKPDEPKATPDMKQAYKDVQSGQQDTDRRHATDEINDGHVNPDAKVAQ
ncbi:hypothetical protein BH10PSE17_BH10PSE17_03760 [soil metagenome]